MEEELKTRDPSDDFRRALRRQVVTAMAKALAKKNFPETPWETMSPGLRKGLLENQLVAFDAQHGIVRVNPIEATEEMLTAAQMEAGDLCESYEYADLFRATSVAGDLTKPD